MMRLRQLSAAFSVGFVAALAAAGAVWVAWAIVETLQTLQVARAAALISATVAGFCALAYELYGKDHK